MRGPPQRRTKMAKKIQDYTSDEHQIGVEPIELEVKAAPKNLVVRAYAVWDEKTARQHELDIADSNKFYYDADGNIIQLVPDSQL